MAAMKADLWADTFEDLKRQSISNQPILFINGYWVKPIYTEKQLTGFAFIPHGIATQNGMKTVLQINKACKGLDSIAADLSDDLLAAHAKRLLDPMVVVDLDTSLGTWWKNAIDTGIQDGGYADSGWWNEIGDGFIFGNNPLGDDTSGVNSGGNWWDEGETIYFSDDPINTNFDTGEDDPEPGGENDFEPHDPDEAWWEDDEEKSTITHCPPPGVCFQTEVIDTLGFDQNFLWDSVNIILNTIMADDASKIVTYAPMAKGETDMSVLRLTDF